MVFSDEKQVNIYCTAGFFQYWHDLRKEQRIFSERQKYGDSVMTLAAISYLGTLNILGIEEKNNSTMYCDVLLELLLPSAAETLEER